MSDIEQDIPSKLHVKLLEEYCRLYRYRGVAKLMGRWRAFIPIGSDGRRQYIGSYATELDAVQAYNHYVTVHNLPNQLNVLPS